MHEKHRVRLAAIVSLGLLLAAGCESLDRSPAMRARPGGNAGDFASRMISNVTLENVRPVAAQAFRSAYRLDLDRSTGMVLVSRPTEVSDPQRTERVRDVLGRPNRHRQIATLWMSQEGTSVLLQCQVRLERLDTTERAAFARERGDDRPTDTPIERMGASAPKAREEWVPVGRDRRAEAQTLDAVVRHFAESQPATP